MVCCIIHHISLHVDVNMSLYTLDKRQLLPVTVYSPSTCGMKWQGELLKNYQTRYKYTKMILEFSWQFAQTTLHPIQKKGTVMVLYLKVTTQWPQAQAGTILSKVKCSRQTLKLVCHPCNYNWKLNTVKIIFLAGDLLHELSNDGAKNQFQYFVEEYILPVMVSSAKVK